MARSHFENSVVLQVSGNVADLISGSPPNEMRRKSSSRPSQPLRQPGVERVAQTEHDMGLVFDDEDGLLRRHRVRLDAPKCKEGRASRPTPLLAQLRAALSHCAEADGLNALSWQVMNTVEPETAAPLPTNWISRGSFVPPQSGLIRLSCAAFFRFASVICAGST